MPVPELYKANALTATGVVLKNGSAGAPAIEEDADWPMANLLSPDRYTYWKTPSGATITTVDFDLGSSQTIRACGIAMQRIYSTSVQLFTDYTVQFDNGATYPPAAWTDVEPFLSQGPQGAHASNHFTTIAATAGRFWRFILGFADPHPNSLKLWLVKDADRILLGKQWTPGSIERNRRVIQEVRTPAGLPFTFEPAESMASDLRGGAYRYLGITTTERDKLRDLAKLDTRFIIKLHDSRVIETALTDGEISWSRRFGPPDLWDVEFELKEHP